MMLTRADTAIDSKIHLEELRKGITDQSTTTGAINKVPAASASHQVGQVTTESEKLSLSTTMNPAKAMVELIIVVGTKQMIANLAMLEGVPNVWCPFDQRLISRAPANAGRTGTRRLVHPRASQGLQ